MVFYWFGLFSPLEAEYRWHSGCCACSSLKGYWVREFKTFPLNMYHTPCDRKKHNFCSYNCRKPKSVKFRCQLCTRTKAPLTGSFSRFIVDWTSASCVLCWLHSSKPGWELQMRHTVLPLARGGVTSERGYGGEMGQWAGRRQPLEGNITAGCLWCFDSLCTLSFVSWLFALAVHLTKILKQWFIVSGRY